MKKAAVEAYFTLANIKILAMWEIINEYEGGSEHLLCWFEEDGMGRNQKQAMRRVQHALQNPWWLVKTASGLIKIGWRKRVINIDWSDTNISTIVTNRDVTKWEHGVHAYSDEEVIEYLKKLSPLIHVLANADRGCAVA